MFDDKRLSSAAASLIEEAAISRRKILISSITLAEIVYLVEKNRIPPDAYDLLNAAVTNPEHVFAEAALTSGIVAQMRKVPRAQIPDLPDRIIAATAIYFNVPVISRDRRILASDLTTIW